MKQTTASRIRKLTNKAMAKISAKHTITLQDGTMRQITETGYVTADDGDFQVYIIPARQRTRRMRENTSESPSTPWSLAAGSAAARTPSWRSWTLRRRPRLREARVRHWRRVLPLSTEWPASARRSPQARRRAQVARLLEPSLAAPRLPHVDRPSLPSRSAWPMDVVVAS